MTVAIVNHEGEAQAGYIVTVEHMSVVIIINHLPPMGYATTYAMVHCSPLTE